MRKITISFGIFKGEGKYRAIKRQSDDFKKELRRLKDMELLILRENVPAKVNVYKMMREYMGNKITTKYNNFVLKEGYTEEEFSRDFDHFFSVQIHCKMEIE